MKVPETPLEHVAFIDKWTHLVMYGGTCSVVWWEYLQSHQHVEWRKIVVFAMTVPIIMSGIIELLQAYATTTRSGDWMDFAANSAGVGLGQLIGYFILRPIGAYWKKKGNTPT